MLGTYALLGARLFYEPPKSKKVAMIIDKGHDFPPSILDHLNSLDCSLLLRETPHRRTTRGLNTYGPGEFRSPPLLLPGKRGHEY